MQNKDFSKNLEERTKIFAIAIIRLSVLLPDTTEAWVIRKQVTRSGTSIGANYREANRAISRPDFIHKIKICESEASETSYWLEIIEEMGWTDIEKLELVHKECNEILAIFTSIGKSLKR